jgi:hypothetical protein
MLVERAPADRAAAGVGAPAEREPDHRGQRPPGDRQLCRQRPGGGGEDRQHGDQREHGGDACAEQDGVLEEVGEAHRDG